MAYNQAQDAGNDKCLTFLSVSTALVLRTRGAMLYAIEENIIIEIAKVKSDLRRDGGNGPAIKIRK